MKQKEDTDETPNKKDWRSANEFLQAQVKLPLHDRNWNEINDIVAQVCRPYLLSRRCPSSMLDPIVQDTLLQFYKVSATDKLKHSENLIGWFYKVAKNQFLQWCRSHKKEYRQVCHNEVEVIMENEDPIALLEQEETLANVNKSLDELPGKQSLVIKLHYQEEMSLSQIHQILGINMNTLKWILAQGLKAIRRKFGKKK